MEYDVRRCAAKDFRRRCARDEFETSPLSAGMVKLEKASFCSRIGVLRLNEKGVALYPGLRANYLPECLRGHVVSLYQKKDKETIRENVDLGHISTDWNWNSETRRKNRADSRQEQSNSVFRFFVTGAYPPPTTHPNELHESSVFVCLLFPR